MKDIKAILADFEVYAAEQQYQQKDYGLYDPINYIMASKGKKLRPLLLLLSYNLYATEVKEGFPAAYALELFHNFSLVHDDIMDDAMIRRGIPSVFAKYGLNQAILSGDVMLISCYQHLAAYAHHEAYSSLVSEFTQMARLICEGQQMDMQFETTEEVSLEEYLLMIRYKTAELLGSAMRMAGMLAGASKEDLKHLYEIGINAGIAFQIQDDILDTYGGPDFGKKIGGDILQNKKTYLYLKTLELASTDQKQVLDQLFQSEESTIDPEEKITKVRSIFDSVVVREYAAQVKEAYDVLAFSHLDALHIATDKKDELRGFLDQLSKRLV